MKDERKRKMGFALLLSCSLFSYVFVNVQAQDLQSVELLSNGITESSEIVLSELITVKNFIGKLVEVITLPNLG